MLSPSAVSSSESPGMHSSDDLSMPCRKAADGPLGFFVCRVARCAPPPPPPPPPAGVTSLTALLSTAPVHSAWQQLVPATGTQWQPRRCRANAKPVSSPTPFDVRPPS